VNNDRRPEDVASVSGATDAEAVSGEAFKSAAWGHYLSLLQQVLLPLRLREIASSLQLILLFTSASGNQ